MPDETITPPTAEKLPPKITEQEKENFFKSFLSDEPYEENVSIFNGRVKLRFRTLSVEENYDVFKQIDLDKEHDRAKNEDSYLMTIIQYRMGLCLVSVNGEEFAPDVTKETVDIDKETGQSYVYARKELMQKWAVYKLAGVTDAFNRFEAKIKHLTDNLDDPNFWKAAE